MNMHAAMTGDIKRLRVPAAAESEATETARQLSPELARRLARAGYFNMFVPNALGGQQLSPPDAMARFHYLARHDAASAWVTMIGATTALGAAYLDNAIGDEIFAASERITCGIFAPNGRAMRDGDDYIVSGRWAWASGSANADYIGLGCMTFEHEDDEPSGKNVRLLMVPRDKIIFHDTWHTMGLCGTSSGDVELQEARIPMAHSYSLATDTPWAEGALYQMPYFALWRPAWRRSLWVMRAPRWMILSSWSPPKRRKAIAAAWPNAAACRRLWRKAKRNGAPPKPYMKRHLADVGKRRKTKSSRRKQRPICASPRPMRCAAAQRWCAVCMILPAAHRSIKPAPFSAACAMRRP